MRTRAQRLSPKVAKVTRNGPLWLAASSVARRPRLRAASAAGSESKRHCALESTGIRCKTRDPFYSIYNRGYDEGRGRAELAVALRGESESRTKANSCAFLKRASQA